MSWEIDLIGDAADLSILARSFTGPDFSISQSGERFLLTSPKFEVLGESRKIREKSQEFAELLNGAVRLAFESRTPIGVRAVGLLHQDGRRDLFVHVGLIEGHLRVRAASLTVTPLDGTSETYYSADPIRDWVRLASTA